MEAEEELIDYECERFFERAKINESTGCWEWTAITHIKETEPLR